MNTKIIFLKNLLQKYGYKKEAMQVDDIIKTASSISGIVSLGYPPILAKILIERFDKNAGTIAKWLKEYYFYEPNFLQRLGGFLSYKPFGDSEIVTLLKMLDATQSEDKYLQFLKDEEFSIPEVIDLEQSKQLIKQQISKEFFENTFFSLIIINDIKSGKLTNLSQYKKLNIYDANEKYESKKIFKELPALKEYDNGFRWINIGKKSNLVALKMKNCGSVGVMGFDPDRTMIVLFDEHNNPHVIVTYHPNEKRISGDECAASTDLKDKYADYVIDLAKVLGAELDTDKSGAKGVRIKYKLKDIAETIERIGKEGEYIFDDFFKFKDSSGKVFYTNYYYVISIDDFNKAVDFIKSNKDKFQKHITKGIDSDNESELIKKIFNRYTMEDLEHLTNIKFVDLHKYISDYKLKKDNL
jgi:hypothetical protein